MHCFATIEATRRCLPAVFPGCNGHRLTRQCATGADGGRDPVTVKLEEHEIPTMYRTKTPCHAPRGPAMSCTAPAAPGIGCNSLARMSQSVPRVFRAVAPLFGATPPPARGHPRSTRQTNERMSFRQCAGPSPLVHVSVCGVIGASRPPNNHRGGVRRAPVLTGPAATQPATDP